MPWTSICRNCIAANCITQNGYEWYLGFKSTLVKEINALGIKSLHIEALSPLNGIFVNLEYMLGNGERIKFLNDIDIYLGAQVEVTKNRCYGVVANAQFILVCEYGPRGENPELVLYKKR